MQTPIIYYCGTEESEEDKQLLLRISEVQQAFPDVEFIHLDPTEGLPEGKSVLVILDTIVGIDTVTLFSNLASFTPPPRFTVHDYDLYHDLSILVKLDMLSEFRIIGVPVGWKDSKEIIESIQKVLDPASSAG